MNNKVILEVKDLKKSYHEGKITTEVLKGISLQIFEGEMVAIVGSSGSGKSTLLHMLGTLDRPSSGQILFKDEEISQWSSNRQADFRNHSLGFIYQFHHLLNEFTAVENVAMPLLICKVNQKAAYERAEQMLGLVGLSGRMDHKPSELSGGERQRVAIARALVNNPDIVLADEPTGNLDFKTAGEIFELMREIHRRITTVFVVVTHDRELAQKFDRRIEIRDGMVSNG